MRTWQEIRFWARLASLLPSVLLEVYIVGIRWGAEATQTSMCKRRIARMFEDKARKAKCKYTRLHSQLMWKLYRIEVEKEKRGMA